MAKEFILHLLKVFVYICTQIDFVVSLHDGRNGRERDVGTVNGHNFEYVFSFGGKG